MDKQPKAPVLPRIAAQMKAMARERSQSQDPQERATAVTHVLGHGARLALRLVRMANPTTDLNDKPVWRLRISREGTFPGPVEMDTFRRDFGVTFPWRQENQTYSAGSINYFAYVLQWQVEAETEPA